MSRFQVTRVAKPDPAVLAICGLFMAAPGILAVWRVTNGVGNGAAPKADDEDRLREVVRQEIRRLAREGK